MRKVQSGRNAASVVLVGLDGNSMGMVRETLSAEAVLPSSSTSFGDAIAVAKRTRPDVIIVGFQEHLEAALALGEALLKELPSLTLVALAPNSDAEIILAAMRVGYKEFVVLPDDAGRLRQVVHDAAYAPDDDDEKGLVVTVCGAKGGVGTTMIVTNLAAELGAIHRVIALDLDFSMGDVAPMLDLAPKDNLADLLPRADRIDERMLTGAVAVHRSKVHVLAQPGDLVQMGEVSADDIYSVVNAAARGYQFVLMDVGTSFGESAELALSVSDVIILVATPDVIAVRDAYRRLKLIESFSVERGLVRLVVNRQHRGAYVSLPNIENSLGIKVIATVSDDSRTVDQAINEGRTLREINRRSEVANDISTLVAVLTETVEPEDAPTLGGGEDKGFLFGLFKRG